MKFCPEMLSNKQKNFSLTSEFFCEQTSTRFVTCVPPASGSMAWWSRSDWGTNKSVSVRQPSYTNSPLPRSREAFHWQPKVRFLLFLLSFFFLWPAKFISLSALGDTLDPISQRSWWPLSLTLGSGLFPTCSPLPQCYWYLCLLAWCCLIELATKSLASPHLSPYLYLVPHYCYVYLLKVQHLFKS